MTRFLSFLTLILTFAQLSYCVPGFTECNTEVSKKKTETSSSQEKELEKEKEESSLTRQNDFSDRVITQFYYINTHTAYRFSSTYTAFQNNFHLNQPGLYLQYANLRI